MTTLLAVLPVLLAATAAGLFVLNAKKPDYSPTLYENVSPAKQKVGSPCVVQPVKPDIPGPTANNIPTVPVRRPTSGTSSEGMELTDIVYDSTGRIISLVEEADGKSTHWEYVYDHSGNFLFRKRKSTEPVTTKSSSGLTIPGEDITYRVLVSPVEDCVGFEFDYRVCSFSFGTMSGDRKVCIQDGREWQMNVAVFEYNVEKVDMEFHEISVVLDQPATLAAFGTPRVHSDSISAFDNDIILKAAWIADYNYVHL